MCSRAIPSLWFDLNNRFGKCFNFVMYHHFFKSFSRLNISTRLCRVEACLRLFRNPLNNPGRYRVLSYLVQNQSINISINAKQGSFLINIVLKFSQLFWEMFQLPFDDISRSTFLLQKYFNLERQNSGNLPRPLCLHRHRQVHGRQVQTDPLHQRHQETAGQVKYVFVIG